ncbi:Ion channel [Aquiflexum balticum DSM 16537]|uniref:Ion channel n=1 Tax=Aquiflexum balticum DSM 16537 TaxID=758820 RepID=A0A1W2H7Q5_9BACT|nr:potassium channel family protein [Aquiflexum balticum]SMD44945.1 Ion channel [Aquiflexum balticum DSM 16537]
MFQYFKKAKNYWISDASFGSLLIMLLFTVFVLPAMIESKGDTTIFLNIMFFLLFFVGIFSATEKGFLIASISMVTMHLLLRLIRFTDNPYEFYLLERIVIILNLLLLIFINMRLLFRDEEVNKYRVAGAINVYLLVALAGAFGFEYIHLSTGQSIGGDVILTGKDEDFGNYMYFSLVSTSTVGFGELYPVGMTARMLSVFLSVTGVLFPAIVIAKLVSLGSQKK